MTMTMPAQNEGNKKGQTDWHELSPEEVLSELQTPITTGLSSEEARRRLELHGPNQLTEKAKKPFYKLLFEQFNNFIVILLIVAALVSAFLGEWVEAGAIFAIVLLNAVLGVVQESRAQQALAALKKLASPEAQVIREGKRTSLPASELVPGDIVFLEAGNFIPADLRLLETFNLRIEEAALTGESVPVEKNAAIQLNGNVPLGDRKNTAFMGTTINYGRGKGVTVSTGMNTQLGLIAAMLQGMEEGPTPLQERLDKLGKTLGWAALVVCAIVFLVGLVGSDMSLETITSLFMIAVSLAIAAVPEGLPAVVTISLAMGMREMVKRHALIRRLSSVETLGSATVICTDKTGTLTQNQMTVTRLWVDGAMLDITGSGYASSGDFFLDGKKTGLSDVPGAGTALWVGALNNDALLEKQDNQGGPDQYRIIGDPTEGSILVAAAKAGAIPQDLQNAYPRTNEVPFDSDRKRMITVHSINKPDPDDLSPFDDDNNKQMKVVTVKGAPDVVLGLCKYYNTLDDKTKPLDVKTRERILAANDLMTKGALRVLGMAFSLVSEIPADMDPAVLEKDLTFVGMTGLIDPARPEVAPALKKAESAGIRSIMITGDFSNTAKAIAETIGLLKPGRKILTGNELNEMDEPALQKAVMEADVYARVSPEHKVRIVNALRSNGEVVAMTGDGVNDAPAIQRADIGVAMGITGTDVAKETADMVLTDDNYASIVSAIEQGRIIYSNIRKFVYYLLSCNAAEIMIIFLATLVTGRSPLTAIQILWLNLVTDGAPALALSTEKGDPDIMEQAPRPPGESIINRYMLIGIVIQTVFISAATLGAYWIGLSNPEHLPYAATMAFVTLSLGELLRAFTARSEYFPILKIGVFNNRWMNMAVLASLSMIILVVYVPFLQEVFDTEPLGLQQWLNLLPLILLPSIGAELTKLFFSPRKSNGKT